MINPNATAFDGPIPPAAPLEADENTQLFYYYYEDDLDDTQVGFWSCWRLLGVSIKVLYKTLREAGVQYRPSRGVWFPHPLWTRLHLEV